MASRNFDDKVLSGHEKMKSRRQSKVRCRAVMQSSNKFSSIIYVSFEPVSFFISFFSYAFNLTQSRLLLFLLFSLCNGY